jgi:hypothetical protein
VFNNPLVFSPNLIAGVSAYDIALATCVKARYPSGPQFLILDINPVKEVLEALKDLSKTDKSNFPVF